VRVYSNEGTRGGDGSGVMEGGIGRGEELDRKEGWGGKTVAIKNDVATGRSSGRGNRTE